MKYQERNIMSLAHRLFEIRIASVIFVLFLMAAVTDNTQTKNGFTSNDRQEPYPVLQDGTLISRAEILKLNACCTSSFRERLQEIHAQGDRPTSSRNRLPVGKKINRRSRICDWKCQHH